MQVKFRAQEVDYSSTDMKIDSIEVNTIGL